MQFLCHALSDLQFALSNFCLRKIEYEDEQQIASTGGKVCSTKNDPSKVFQKKSWVV